MLTHTRQFAAMIGLVTVLIVPAAASADLLQSSHFRLDPNAANTFGGTGSSGSYKLTDSGGEASVGTGASQSYKLTQGYVSQLAHSLQLSVMPSGTLAYWPFDTGNGITAYDVSMTGLNGDLQNAPTWTTGKIGQALSFNGTNQYMSTNALVAKGDLTEELWFKTTTNTGGRLLGMGNAKTGASTVRDRHIYMADTGQIYFGVNPGTQQVVFSPASYNDGQWHHVGASVGPAGQTLIVDGIRVGYNAAVTAGQNQSEYLRVGYDSMGGWAAAPTSNFFAGSIDEVRAFGRQLSDAEVVGDYTAGLNGLRFAHTLPNVTPGTSSTFASDAVVRTDAGGYNLFIQATGLLKHTDGTTTIPMIPATVASPSGWVEGTTKGLGFTVSAATQIESKWVGLPYNYAAVPLQATAYHTRTGLNGGIPELTTLQFRADTLPNQKQGTYSSTVVYTATLKP